jgi:Zn-finger nucleic acid-binding protein
MKCPVCNNVNLVMSERQGIEIDYCPECRGVWLDRGELDKIIERSPTRESSPPPQQQHQEYRKGDHQQEYGGQNHYHGQKPYRKKSFLEELFD